MKQQTSKPAPKLDRISFYLTRSYCNVTVAGMTNGRTTTRETSGRNPFDVIQQMQPADRHALAELAATIATACTMADAPQATETTNATADPIIVRRPCENQMPHAVISDRYTRID